jgi:acetolactate synthase I/II/III large subunit
MRTADAIWDIVKRYTDTVYFVPGGQAAFLVDALGWSGLNHISMLHEQGAAFAACGHAMQTGGLGVCLVTSGPGATNAITGCAAAWMDSIPVLFISGQAKSTTLIGDTGLRVRGVQEVDIIPMVIPITKEAYPPRPGEFRRSHLEFMIDRCLADRRGPCWLDVPLDVQAEEL